MNREIVIFNEGQNPEDQAICELLAKLINNYMPEETESKIWHKHPVWFLDGNPIVGYSKQKVGIRLMFWSGADFEEDLLKPGTGKFKDASIFYKSVDEIKEADMKRWLSKSQEIQWDYKNIYKRKGKLVKLK